MRNIEQLIRYSESVYNKHFQRKDTTQADNTSENISIDSSRLTSNIKMLNEIDTDKYYSSVENHIRKSKRRSLYINIYKVAAVITIVFSISLLYINLKDYKEEALIVDISIPQRTLNSTKTILVNSTGEQFIVGESKLEKNDKSIVSVGANSLVYSNKNASKSNELKYNTIIVPKKEFFKICLSDGTKVWVNADSQIRYPSVFAEDKREVFVKGEAYFEVARDEKKAFYVHVGESIVKVLGTAFNLKTNSSNELITTLVHGKIELSNRESSRILKPGNQAIVTTKGIEVYNVDLSEVTAWKDGYFVFKDKSLAYIYNEIASWYGVEVIFQDKSLEKIKYNSKLKRFDDINNLLEVLNKLPEVETTIRKNTIYIQRK